MAWFGVKLRMVVLVEGIGATSVNDGVFVVWADEWEEVLQTALKLGREQESEYLNGDGQRVRWRFAEVLQIHSSSIRDGDEIEGQEVMTEFLDDVPELPFDAEFHPESSRPADS